MKTNTKRTYLVHVFSRVRLVFSRNPKYDMGMRETTFLILNGMYTCHLMAKDRLEMPEKQGQLPVEDTDHQVRAIMGCLSREEC